MPSPTVLALALAGVAAIFLVNYVVRLLTGASLPLPPGPRRLPVIGNLLQMPKSHAFLLWQKWSQKYGPVIYLSVLGVNVVALHTVKSAQDLLARRGARYSDRPRLVLAGELACKGMQLLLMPYDANFKLHQKLMAPVLSQTSATAYQPLADLESRQLLADILAEASSSSSSSSSSPGPRRGVDVNHHLERCVASTTYSLVFGERLPTGREAAIARGRDIQADFAALLVGPNLVDAFPALDRVPLLRRRWRRLADRHWAGQMDFHLGNLRAALARPGWSFAREMGRGAGALGVSEAELAFDLGVIADAAMDTTAVSLGWFVIAWLTQDRGGEGGGGGGGGGGFAARARRQLDAVVGRDRLPGFGDRPRLPLVDAVVEEVLRWRPIAPAGMPHVARAADVYEGLRIPAGSLVSANLWAIGRDPAVFGADADAFRPERWLVDDGPGEEGGAAAAAAAAADARPKSEGASPLRGMPTVGFGFGRRACPGRHLARNAMWIQVARLLWAFDVEGAVSQETGERVDVDPSPLKAVDSLVIRPQPFNVLFKPRGPWVEKAVEDTCNASNEDFVGLLDNIGVDRAARQVPRDGRDE